MRTLVRRLAPLLVGLVSAACGTPAPTGDSGTQDVATLCPGVTYVSCHRDLGGGICARVGGDTVSGSCPQGYLPVCQCQCFSSDMTARCDDAGSDGSDAATDAAAD